MQNTEELCAAWICGNSQNAGREVEVTWKNVIWR